MNKQNITETGIYFITVHIAAILKTSTSHNTNGPSIFPIASSAVHSKYSLIKIFVRAHYVPETMVCALCSQLYKVGIIIPSEQGS